MVTLACAALAIFTAGLGAIFVVPVVSFFTESYFNNKKSYKKTLKNIKSILDFAKKIEKFPSSESAEPSKKETSELNITKKDFREKLNNSLKDAKSLFSELDDKISTVSNSPRPSR